MGLPAAKAHGIRDKDKGHRLATRDLHEVAEAPCDGRRGACNPREAPGTRGQARPTPDDDAEFKENQQHLHKVPEEEGLDAGGKRPPRRARLSGLLCRVAGKGC